MQAVFWSIRRRFIAAEDVAGATIFKPCREKTDDRLSAPRLGAHMLLILFIVLAAAAFFAAQWSAGRYQSMMEKGSRVTSPTAHTGAEIARLFLDFEGRSDVAIVEHNSVVSDYYDRKRKRLFLRTEAAQGTTLSAWATALHEAAHAVQDTDPEGGHVKNRQTCIAFCRYLPMVAMLVLGTMAVVRMMPMKMALMALAGVFTMLTAWNAGTVSVEFAANRQLRAFLDRHLARHEQARERLDELLSSMALREGSDVLRSPRYFFLSALPGSGTSRPRKVK